MLGSLGGFAEEPQTAEFTDVSRRSAALGYHRAFIVANANVDVPPLAQRAS